MQRVIRTQQRKLSVSTAVTTEDMEERKIRSRDGDVKELFKSLKLLSRLAKGHHQTKRKHHFVGNKDV